ncbi:protein SPEAR3-like isoform X2 [Neltuma alba]|uniref:protein SPEAR3-like isoform X2 n=1 Tax=Neltuma alba TaxID=207710 RepID=UPI0010A4C9DF|nr:protein SPEAR3-like isoform X2 [Prosopis alba]
MGSGYFGELNLGSTERASGSSASSSSSSRKGKKNNSDKPKQPQRGLGVAQLEKIRLHGQIDCGYPPPPPLHVPYPSNFNNEDPRAQSAYSSVPSSSFSYSPSSSSYSPSYCFHPNIAQMGLPEYERTNIRYGSSQPPNAARWDNSNSVLHTQSSAQPNVTRPFLNLYDHSHLHIDSQQHRSGSFGSSSQNSESSDPQEPDLELRLSL